MAALPRNCKCLWEFAKLPGNSQKFVSGRGLSHAGQDDGCDRARLQGLQRNHDFRSHGLSLMSGTQGFLTTQIVSRSALLEMTDQFVRPDGTYRAEARFDLLLALTRPGIAALPQ